MDALRCTPAECSVSQGEQVLVEPPTVTVGDLGLHARDENKHDVPVSTVGRKEFQFLQYVLH